jgi:hypothetical protein
MVDSVDIEALKSDSEFLENLKNLEQEVKDTDSLAKIYQLLDVYLALQDNEDMVNELFQKVVDGSFEAISTKLENNESLDMGNPDDWAAARGIYEHAISLYSENHTKSAQELFLALHYTISDFEIKDAMMLHAAAIASGYSFDDFMNKLAKIEQDNFDDPKAVFITTFAKPVDALQETFKEEITNLNEQLDKLKKAQEESK